MKRQVSPTDKPIIKRFRTSVLGAPERYVVIKKKDIYGDEKFKEKLFQFADK